MSLTRSPNNMTQKTTICKTKKRGKKIMRKTLRLLYLRFRCSDLGFNSLADGSVVNQMCGSVWAVDFFAFFGSLIATVAFFMEGAAVAVF
jgi:hypothetical protein